MKTASSSSTATTGRGLCSPLHWLLVLGLPRLCLDEPDSLSFFFFGVFPIPQSNVIIYGSSVPSNVQQQCLSIISPKKNINMATCFWRHFPPASFRNQSRFILSSRLLLYRSIDAKLCSRNNNKETKIWERETGQQGFAPSSSPIQVGNLPYMGNSKENSL